MIDGEELRCRWGQNDDRLLRIATQFFPDERAQFAARRRPDLRCLEQILPVVMTGNNEAVIEVFACV